MKQRKYSFIRLGPGAPSASEQLRMLAEELEIFEKGLASESDPIEKSEWQESIYGVYKDIEIIGNWGVPKGWMANSK